MKLRIRAVLVGGLIVAACAPAAPRGAGLADDPTVPSRIPASFPAGWKYRVGNSAPFAAHAMVVSASRPASEAGIEILRRGGNAIDAAVATEFALAVVHPEAGNLGGGGFMLIRMADGRTAALDYREAAPLSASRNMYIAPDGHVTAAGLSGPLASGVPGAVAGMTEALAKWGRLPLSVVIAPALRLAEEGFAVDSALNASINASDSLIRPFAGREVFLSNEGHAPSIGSLLKQPALAKTLRLIAGLGQRAFYDGPIAEEIVAEERRGGGNITREDLRSYRPQWRTPLKTTYRGYGLLMMPPVSSGGVTIGETFNILGFLGEAAPFGSVRSTHTLAAAYQRAFVDRNNKLGDPAFVKNPVERLLSMDYARRLAAEITPNRATPTMSMAPMGEENETTHFSVIDADGNAVATTTTLNELYGSGVFVRGAGFFLNDEMDDFTAKPGSPNLYKLVQGEANAIAPGKRMLSAMSPTIVFDPAGRIFLVLGGRGGPRIITSVSQVIRNVIDYRMTLSDALSAPRIHHQALPDSIRYDRGGFAPAVIDSLKAMGYGMQPVGYIGGKVNAIMRVRGGLEGLWDPRGVGGTAGY